MCSGMAAFGCNHLHFLLITTILFPSAVQGFWRMRTNGISGLARLDPIVDPGQVSGHLHIVHGGSNFGFNTTYDDLIHSKCTSASVYQDNSAYWTPALMFQFTNGSVVMAQEMQFVAYYFLNSSPNITAFPKGFRMLTGNPTRRTYHYQYPYPYRPWSGAEVSQDALREKSIGFNCLPGEGTLDRHFMPSKPYLEQHCSVGLRLEVAFPACWDGVNVVSPDGQSHVAYLDQVIAGNCPSSHPIGLPGLMYEQTYNVINFKDYEGQYILSTGDPTGYSLHGDFFNGWDIDFLQNAINTCNPPDSDGQIESCPIFDINPSASSDCTFATPSILSGENPTGPRQGLPGNPSIVSTGTAPSPHGTGTDTFLAVSSSEAEAMKSITTAPTPTTPIVPTYLASGSMTSIGSPNNMSDESMAGGTAVQSSVTANPEPTSMTSMGDASPTRNIAVQSSVSENPQPTSMSSVSDASPAESSTVGGPVPQSPESTSVMSSTNSMEPQALAPVATSYYTSGNVVWEVVEDVVTMTVTAAQKRHVHRRSHPTQRI